MSESTDMGDAIFVVEYKNISQGIAALDKLVKRAELLTLHAAPICIGKYLIALGGDVGGIREAEAEAAALAARPLGSYVLTGAHPAILRYFRREAGAVSMPASAPFSNEAIAIIETRTVAAGFNSLDQALKYGGVGIARVWVGQFLGGKMCYVLSGGVSDAEAAAKAAEAAVTAGELVGAEVIPSPDKAVMDALRGQYAPVGIS